MYTAIQFGYGRHLWDIRAVSLVPSHLQVRQLQMVASASLIRNQQMASLPFFGSSSTLSLKISVFLLYLRIFHINQRFRYSVYFGVLFCSLYTAVYCCHNSQVQHAAESGCGTLCQGKCLHPCYNHPQCHHRFLRSRSANWDSDATQC